MIGITLFDILRALIHETVKPITLSLSKDGPNSLYL